MSVELPASFGAAVAYGGDVIGCGFVVAALVRCGLRHARANAERHRVLLHAFGLLLSASAVWALMPLMPLMPLKARQLPGGTTAGLAAVPQGVYRVDAADRPAFLRAVRSVTAGCTQDRAFSRAVASGVPLANWSISQLSNWLIGLLANGPMGQSAAFRVRN
jgi:hypothetical protein